MRLFLNTVYLLLFVFGNFKALADGSKDLYPKGVRGGRAFMESMTYAGVNLSHKFYNHAKHFAYVRNGETLAVASSAQGVRNGTIRIISPTGAVFSNGNNLVKGKIIGSNGMSNRDAELAGPRSGYEPFEVKSDEEGIWTVEFFTPDSLLANNNIPNILADENWNQPDGLNIIAAWDVSVRNTQDSEWLQGRVFVNVLNIHMNGGNMADPTRAFYGVNYVLTKDGYYYKVDGNGGIGLKFTYFVNNSGILNDDGSPSYKSSIDGYRASVHDPNTNDVGTEYITHKIFYSLPNNDLPTQSSSYRGNTWLLNEIEIPTVEDIHFISSEETEKNINAKGAKIGFVTNYSGRYKITIRSTDSLVSFPYREIIYQATVGANLVVWDAKDGEGKMVPSGDYRIEASIASIEGEVHFPYFDTEINPNGLKLERVDRTSNTVQPAILYWDDSDIPKGAFLAEHSNPIVNLSGIPSNINGHRWGTYNISTPGGGLNNNLFTGSNSFGNNMAMDTWSYAVHVEESIAKDIVVAVADLEVVGIEVDKDTIELNEQVNYTISVRNNGPSDAIGAKFEYSLPLGFIIENITFKDSDCANIGAVNISSNSLLVPINIKNGCLVEFSIKAYANNVPDATYGFVNTEAGIVRPVGITDPDATSTDNAELAPKSAREECSPDGCNNVKINRDVFLLEPVNERGKVALRKSVRHIDTDKNGFQEIGEMLEYTFTVKNVGFVQLKGLVIVDSLLSSQPISLQDIVLMPTQEHSITVQYTITEDDVQKKHVENTASIIGQNPRNFNVTDVSGTQFNSDDLTIIDIDKSPLIQLRKIVVNRGSGENGRFTLGDSIKYALEVKHQGDIPIEKIKITDHLLFNESQLVYAGQMKNQTMVFEYSYPLNNADVQVGFVENTALVEVVDSKYNNSLHDISGTTFENDEKTITLVATAPVAVEDFLEIYQGNISTLDILKNDKQGNSNWSDGHIEIIEQPTLGNLAVDGLTVQYTQFNNFESGLDYFTYRVYDNSRLMSNIVRVELTIVKTIPKAIDDYFIQHYNSNTTMTPAQNDSVEYSELDFESITIINQPLNGTLRYLGNGEFKYESNKTFSGVDEFTYRIMDKNGNWSDPATVKVDVSGFLIPNVITPNGDGLNDTFEIIGLYQFETVEIQLFDRFKNLIHHDLNYKNNWQVSNTVRDGTYFYILKLNKKGTKTIIKKGSILITRELLN
ncbi:DUF7507 domain-containing protein [Sphingobacterium bovistauri]|uniref:Gliding motility-associated C-terminal domain-containing protein n=1 Tax=Sphingobacterium bovistauri TaxID=2781959 RepID=A0ABS7Z0Y5_9SPHI|nr:gliding motility-associated C-terminal domain-containing protein [Sphingobacterium bovistauri]MCA5003633.1 gliding motility-associated C-terminal domain-containing protein [Sphingobacterium bovistauri]